MKQPDRAGRKRCCPKSSWKSVCKTKGKGMAHPRFALVDTLLPVGMRVNRSEATLHVKGTVHSRSQVSRCWSGLLQVSTVIRLSMTNAAMG